MIYLDLDDVCADLTGYVNRAFGINKEVGEPISKEHWVELARYHPRLFKDLDFNEPFRKFYQEILEYAGEKNIAFLTAIPYHSNFHYAIMDKVDWVREQLTVKHPIFFGPYSQDKQFHCKPGDILIDDSIKNCTQWESRGGKAIIYRNESFFENWRQTI